MPELKVRLELDCCGSVECRPLAETTFELLSGRYERDCSVMALPSAMGRTASKRAIACLRLGYRFEEIERRLHEDDVFEINTSKGERQGRPMAAPYLEPVEFSQLPEYGCDRHAIRTYGVLLGDKLLAYSWVYRVGELAMVSSILGHADHLENHVMYLLMLGALNLQNPLGGTLFYNLHSSGTDGLRFFKERIGLRPGDVRWER